MASPDAIESDVLGLVPRETAAAMCFLPLSVEAGTVTVAVPDGYDAQLVHDLSFLLGHRIKPEPMEKQALQDAIDRHYGIARREIRSGPVSQENPTSWPTAGSDNRAEGSGNACAGVNTSAVSLATRIISDAIRLRASDIHIEPYEQSMRVRYRLDGVLHEVLRLPVVQSRALVSRVKIMADLDIAERRRPQDGRIRMKEGSNTIDIRVSSLPTDFGEKIVLRILDKSQLQLDLDKLGFEEKDLKLFTRVLGAPYGLVLVTGPTGSGKTTTLYAALNHLNRPDINITTIEDPVEYNLPGINQTHVRADIGFTFAAALRSILRQDPNVIMVGEIRDGETAKIAIRAALTGHLVFSTLHTNDAASAMTRLVDMGVEQFLVASSLRLILAQRLLRKICPECACEDVTTKQLEKMPQTGRAHRFLRGKGCPACHHSGYRGRTAVFEMLVMNKELSELMSNGATTAAIREKAKSWGVTSLREAALLKASRGETSLEEVLRETADEESNF